MAVSNRTSDFQQALKERRNASNESNKRRKLAKSKPASSGGGRSQATLGREYIAEAYVILDHVNTLRTMLANIRKPYLNVEARGGIPLSRQSSRSMDLSHNYPDSSWSGIRHLTNEERDQIDLQARVILSRCADRVKEMEALEKRRAQLVATQVNPLARWLPSLLLRDESTISSNFVAVHHSSITWYLNRRLAETSQTQKEMQEERVKRQLERTRSLGSGAAREAMTIGIEEPLKVMPPPSEGTSKGSWLEGASSTLASGLAATIGAGASSSRVTVTVPPPPSLGVDVDEDDEDDEIELSQSQILQFETENASILRAAQDTLESVQLAESRLLDISALQMELVSHLTRQTELTDQLFEDAIATTSSVEQSNVQLREARRRAKDGRIFILVFLVGASLSLLFLHYY